MGLPRFDLIRVRRVLADLVAAGFGFMTNKSSDLSASNAERKAIDSALAKRKRRSSKRSSLKWMGIFSHKTAFTVVVNATVLKSTNDR